MDKGYNLCSSHAAPDTYDSHLLGTARSWDFQWGHGDLGICQWGVMVFSGDWQPEGRSWPPN